MTDNSVYGPFYLPDLVKVPGQGNKSTGTTYRASSLSASKINTLSTSQSTQQATVAASGTLIPLAYGKVRLGGRIFAHGVDGSGNLVIGYAWCLGECNAISSITFNDAAPPAGVTLTHYLGAATQTPDATLQGAIAGFDDSMVTTRRGETVGICYTVAVFPSGAIGGFPKAIAEIESRKVYDDRTGTTAYSTNPILCAADLARSKAFGMNRTVADITTAANYADDLMSDSSKRYQVGISFINPQRASDIVDLLCEYGGATRINEGSSIRIVPLNKVSAPSATITDADYVNGSLQFSVSDITDAPTRVEVTYTDISSSTQPWQSSVAAVNLDGVDAGTKEYVVSRVSMPGIQTYSQAFRVGIERLVRARTGLSVTWTGFDVSVIRQIGDVVKLQSSKYNVTVWLRIKAVTLDSPGRYKVSATAYCDAQSSNIVASLPGTTTVPVGAIAPMISGTVPSGWSSWSTANNYHLIGAGNSYSIGAIGGGGTVIVNGTSSNQGAHTGNTDVFVQGAYGTTSGGAGPPALSAGAHSHTYNAGSNDPNVPHQNYQLIVKTGSAGSLMPSIAGTLANKILSHPSIAEQSPFNGLLKAASSSGTGGAWSTAISITLSTEGAHSHWNTVDYYGVDHNIHFGSLHEYYTKESGAHSHPGTNVNLKPDPKRLRWLLYAGSQDYPIITGMSVLWSGAIGSIPSGWVLCDGNNGTPDTRDRFIELTTSSAGNQGSAAGSDTAYWNDLTTSDGDHNHTNGEILDTGGGLPYTELSAHHSNTMGAHQQTISGSRSWKPWYYALAVIMYVGGDNGNSLEPYNPPNGETPIIATSSANNDFGITWTGNSWAFTLGYLIDVIDESTGNIVASTYTIQAIAGQSHDVKIADLPNGTYDVNLYVVSSVEAISATPGSAIGFSPGVDQTVPDAPTGVSATAGYEQAVITWTAPVNTGNAQITQYTVTASPGGHTATVDGSLTEATVTGLADNTGYTFTVVATNLIGNSQASAPSAAVSTYSVPGAPTGVSASAGLAQASVSWSAPASDGGAAITGYTVTSSPGGHTASVGGSTLSATVTGLANGTTYTFSVTATNEVGTGAASAASNATTTYSTPSAPTSVSASVSGTTATISWGAPSSNGGTAITGYTVTASSGGFSTTVGGSTYSANISGLASGTAYTFTVTATNAVGTGPGTTSNSITTQTPLDIWVFFNNGNVTSHSGAVQWSTQSYPTTRGGITAGFTNQGLSAYAANWSTGNDYRLSGYINFTGTVGNHSDFRIDLPYSGTTTVQCGLGAGNLAASTNTDYIMDNGTNRHTIASSKSIASGDVLDVSDNEYSASAWPGSQGSMNVSMSSTVFAIRITKPGSAWLGINSVRVKTN